MAYASATPIAALERTLSCEELRSHKTSNTSTLDSAEGEAFSVSENNSELRLGVPNPGLDHNLCGQADSCFADFSDEPGLGITNIQGDVEKQEESQSLYTGRCPLNVQVVVDSAIVGSGFLRTGNLSSTNDDAEMNMVRLDVEGEKEKMSRRRGGKARKNRDILKCYSFEKKEEKGFAYSREEMEVLRFHELEEQKKKWVEVYCGLGSLVAQEYDALVASDNNHKLCSVNFDPRSQCHKAADVGEDHFKVIENHVDDLIPSDPASQPYVNDGIDCLTMEEECSNYDDTDEEHNIQRPAFWVTGEPDFDSGPPQDGLEYLRRVRWETARIPKVVVAKVGKSKKQSPYMLQIPDIMDCPENILPCKEWEDRFIADFQELRLAIPNQGLSFGSLFASFAESCSSGLSQLEQLGDLEENPIQLPASKQRLYQMFESTTFKNFNHTRPYESCPSEASSMLKTSDVKVDAQPLQNSSLSNDLPMLSKILKMGSAARSSMLRKRIRGIENTNTLSHCDCLWLFALSASVDCPLDPDTSAAMRSLLRKCASLRAAKADLDDEVAVLNILAMISGRYFGQSEK